MVASGLRTMIAGSLSSCIAGFHQSCRFSQSSSPRRSCVGTGPAFAATGVGSRAHRELDRRDLVWINVTANPTAEWVARQITEAFPWDEAPRHLVRDRDRIYGSVVTRRLRAMGIRDKPTAPASPWQNGFAERLIGSIRRECVDHIIVLGEVHLRQILQSYAHYYNDIRTHRSLDKDAPVSSNSANRKHQITRHPWRTS